MRPNLATSVQGGSDYEVLRRVLTSSDDLNLGCH